MLSCRELGYRYPGGGWAIRGVSLEVRGGEALAVLGANGSGKTTLILLLAGLLDPSSGCVCYNGVDVRELGLRYRRVCGVLFQSPEDQLIAPTVREDIAIGPLQLSFSREEVEKAVREAAMQAGADHLLDRRTMRLSQGEKKRVALAGVLAASPKVLLLDEPASGLDLGGVELVKSLIRAYRSRGCIVVFTTQDSELAAELADRVLLLRSGLVHAYGPAREVLSDLDLLAEAGVKPPSPALAYRQAGLDGSPPLTPGELAEKIRELRGDLG
ncbi:MAG: ABC transporter ATP-binding protein [Thermoproteota archaeon]|nr:MAG: ABC transporter ATP-binding protein [Candidatus Korarchaeota archaeon]